jgi:hypothetical protein
MLTAPQALELADRRQRRAVLDAAHFAESLGEPVRFLHRRAPGGGAVFEAVALESARTCAIVDELGELRYVTGQDRRDPWDHAGVSAATPRLHTARRRAAQRALRTAARPHREP